MSDPITFTPEKLERLRVAHSLATAKMAKSFRFEGRVLDVTYVKYLIEYLDSHFKKQTA